MWWFLKRCTTTNAQLYKWTTKLPHSHDQTLTAVDCWPPCFSAKYWFPVTTVFMPIMDTLGKELGKNTWSWLWNWLIGIGVVGRGDVLICGSGGAVLTVKIGLWGLLGTVPGLHWVPAMVPGLLPVAGLCKEERGSQTPIFGAKDHNEGFLFLQSKKLLLRCDEFNVYQPFLIISVLRTALGRYFVQFWTKSEPCQGHWGRRKSHQRVPNESNGH